MEFTLKRNEDFCRLLFLIKKHTLYFDSNLEVIHKTALDNFDSYIFILEVAFKGIKHVHGGWITCIEGSCSSLYTGVSCLRLC